MKLGDMVEYEFCDKKYFGIIIGRSKNIAYDGSSLHSKPITSFKVLFSESIIGKSGNLIFDMPTTVLNVISTHDPNSGR